MKTTEDFQKGIQQLVDLTKIDQANPSNLIKMPELSLVMSKYFLSLSKLCLTYYHGYSKAASRQEKEKEKSEHSEKQEIEKFACIKKPVTAYILYFQERVPYFQEKYPKCIISELTRLIAKQWKQVSDEIKKPFIDRAAADRKRYESQKLSLKMRKKPQKIDLQTKDKKAAQNEQNSDSLQKQSNPADDDAEEGI